MDEPGKGYTEANRAAWNEVMPLHRQAAGERLDAAFGRPGHVTLDAETLAALERTGIAGLDVAQPCCNNGSGLLSLKNLGARRCVGFDISDAAIDEARARAALCGIPCEFVRTDVYAIDASAIDTTPTTGYGGAFDLVFVSAGSLGWMPDVGRFLGIVAALLRPGGRLLVREIHPVAEMFPFDNRPDADPLRVIEPYFVATPYVEYGGLDYVGGTAYDSALPQYWFVHTLSDVVMAAVGHGLAIEGLWESPRDIGAGHHRQEQLAAGIPLSYTLIAAKPPA